MAIVEKRTRSESEEALEKQAKKARKKERKARAEAEAVAEEAVVEEAPVEEVQAEKKSKKEKKEKKAKTDAEPQKSEKKSKDFSDHSFYAENNCKITGVPAPKPATTFEESGLPEEVIAHLNFLFPDSKPSPIQGAVWPLIRKGHDVFGIAKTGSGKTLAFVLPYLARRYAAAQANGGKDKGAGRHYPRALCLAPTKELVQQIAEVTQEFCGILGIQLHAHCIIGGVPKGEQIRKIESSKCDFVIATPGRLLDLVENDQVLNLSKCEYLVLDEADRMLDDGFILSIRKIAEYCAGDVKRQTVLFSATWPIEVNKLARGLVQMGQTEVRDPAIVTVLKKGQSRGVDDKGNINAEDRLQLNDAISHTIHVLEDGKPKWNLLLKALNENKGKKTLVFGLYKKEVAQLETWLRGTDGDKFKIAALQGDMMQSARSRAIEDFKANRVRTLVATDVAGRGLDISDIELVVNYTFPLTVEDFVHRCGRTGRAGRTGHAVTFFNKLGEFKEKEHCFDLIRLLEGAKQPVPEALSKLNAGTFTATKKKAHSMYGDFFKSAEEMEKLSAKKVHTTFDSDSE